MTTTDTAEISKTSEGNGSKGSARTVLGSSDWFRSGGWHYADGALATGVIARHGEMTFPGDITRHIEER
ncbi:hypothetical protein ACFQZZ_17075 [Nocardia sp. GCM10030253]|uniref:hypothetical protein n=1 Tax=Nocardia sp. GCM10030253 TaxID=3273404 RepID=UPI00363308CB